MVFKVEGWPKPNEDTKMEIIYYADNGSMGDTGAQDCEKFRNWALAELQSEYPGYDITVSEDQSMQTAYTDDVDNEESIIDFCSRLWDRCQWGWIA